MQWFYFVKTGKRVAVFAQHYRTAAEADQAFYDSIRLYYPVPAILYDRGYPFYSYYAYLAHVKEEQEHQPEPVEHVRVQL